MNRIRRFRLLGAGLALWVGGRVGGATVTPAINSKLSVMLAGDWVPANSHEIDFDHLPRIPSQPAVVSDVLAAGGHRVNQHNYVAHFAGRFWAMWSDGPGESRGQGKVPGHDRADQHVSFATSADGLNWGAIANSIFVYEMGSLCIAHLGNIGHLLTDEQVKVLQRVDIMMIPIDAMTNLGFEDIIKLVDQVKPPIVIPMHYDMARQAELFAAFAREHYPIKLLAQSQLTLNRSMLPKTTEIYVLAHPRD